MPPINLPPVRICRNFDPVLVIDYSYNPIELGPITLNHALKILNYPMVRMVISEIINGNLDLLCLKIRRMNFDNIKTYRPGAELVVGLDPNKPNNPYSMVISKLDKSTRMWYNESIKGAALEDIIELPVVISDPLIFSSKQKTYPLNIAEFFRCIYNGLMEK